MVDTSAALDNQMNRELLVPVFCGDHHRFRFYLHERKRAPRQRVSERRAMRTHERSVLQAQSQSQRPRWPRACSASAEAAVL